MNNSAKVARAAWLSQNKNRKTKAKGKGVGPKGFMRKRVSPQVALKGRGMQDPRAVIDSAVDKIAELKEAIRLRNERG